MSRAPRIDRGRGLGTTYLSSRPPRFYVPAYFGPGGWLSFDFTAAEVDWGEVAELMESSYRQVALKRMLKALESP